MSIKIKQEHEKDIIVLNQFEAIRKKPNMYMGNVKLLEEKVTIIKDDSIIHKDIVWSQGLMQMMIEIFENALDEAKRCKGSMESIDVFIDFDANSISVRDYGGGFRNANNIHPKTNKTIVRTALEELHAGSNFADNDKNILGTHGVGSSCVNILSKYFRVTTQNETHFVEYKWDDFNVIDETIKKRKPTKNSMGTEIEFTPSTDVFGDAKWDSDIIRTYLSFKQFMIKRDSVIGNLVINTKCKKDGIVSEFVLSENFIPECISVETKMGQLFLWRKIENGTSVGFVNGSNCTGAHINIIKDWVNTYFGYNLAHHFYDFMFVLNVPSSLMLFSEQNKTKYAISRQEIEPLLEKDMKRKIISAITKSSISKDIKDDVEKRLYNDNIKKIRAAQKNNKKKISDKYHAPSKIKRCLYITEGDSAKGGILQSRNGEEDGVYALRGKIKNTRHLSDLANNKEITDIMSILCIEPNTNKDSAFEYVIIATDPDPDGIGHICPLTINFFYRWFPQVIKNNHLYILSTPLVVCNSNGDRKYFYSIDEFNEYAKHNKVTSVNYLKGLGSLNQDDWDFVMNNKVLFQVTIDSNAKKYLDIAFGDSVKKRKEWLSSK